MKIKLLWPILLMSCAQQITIDDLDSTPTTVVNAIYYPDSTLQVYLSESHYYNTSQNASLLTDAEVKLYKNGAFVETLTVTDSIYNSVSTGEIGANYELEIIRGNEDTKRITAETYLPVPVAIDTAYKIIDNHSTIELFFKDDPQEENYYELMFYRDYTRHNAYLDSINFQGEYRYSYSISGTQSSNEIITRNGLDHTEEYLTQLFTDQAYNGASIHLTLSSKDSESFTVTDEYVVLYAVTKAYYEYKLALVAQYYDRSLEEDYDSEDFIDPKVFKALTPVPTNVSGGVGIFSGISFTKKQSKVIW